MDRKKLPSYMGAVVAYCTISFSLSFVGAPPEAKGFSIPDFLSIFLAHAAESRLRDKFAVISG